MDYPTLSTRMAEAKYFQFGINLFKTTAKSWFSIITIVNSA